MRGVLCGPEPADSEPARPAPPPAEKAPDEGGRPDGAPADMTRAHGTDGPVPNAPGPDDPRPEGPTPGGPTPDDRAAPDRRHAVATPDRWPWLPTHDANVLARHPYCERCGAVKVLGREAGVKFGTLVNILAKLKRRLAQHDGAKVTEAQQRLILKRLKAEQADDRFAVPRSGQLDLLARAVADSTGLDADHVRAVLRSC